MSHSQKAVNLILKIFEPLIFQLNDYRLAVLGNVPWAKKRDVPLLLCSVNTCMAAYHFSTHISPSTTSKSYLTMPGLLSVSHKSTPHCDSYDNILTAGRLGDELVYKIKSDQCCIEIYNSVTCTVKASGVKKKGE